MKVIPIAQLGMALAAMTVLTAVQMPPNTGLLALMLGWAEGETNALAGKLGVSVFSEERGQQHVHAGDWIVNDDDRVIDVLSDVAFKAMYAPAPDGAGVAEVAITNTDEASELGMPRWQSHKIVMAAPIAAIDIDDQLITLDQPGAPVFAYRAELFARGLARLGDYLVCYANDYVSWSPKAVFEDGYTPVMPDQVPQAAAPDPATSQAA
jgi:hypothetical protein